LQTRELQGERASRKRSRLDARKGRGEGKVQEDESRLSGQAQRMSRGIHKAQTLKPPAKTGKQEKRPEKEAEKVVKPGESVYRTQ